MPHPPERHPTARARPAAGFTLMELVVALAVSGLLLLGLQALVALVGDTSRRAVAEARWADAESNQERTTRELFLQTGPEVSPGSRFAGTPDSVAFTSSCPVAGGWFERCAVMVTIQSEDTLTVVRVASSAGSFVLLRAPGLFEFGYLRDPSGEGLWLRRWAVAIAPPLAVRLLGPDRELIFRVGERG